MKKPVIFVGCSTEALETARAVQSLLSPHCDVRLWNDRDVFRPGMAYLESLVQLLDDCDFAILVLEGEDSVESRGTSQLVPRDNVLFELGLFMGRLGRSRSFILESEAADLKLPSDLHGIKTIKYRPQHNTIDAIRPACEEILHLLELHMSVDQQQRLQEANVHVLQNPMPPEYDRLFDNFTAGATFLAYNAPFKIEGEAGDPHWESALETHARRYEAGVKSKYLFFDSRSQRRAEAFFRVLEARMQRELIGTVIRMRCRAVQPPPTTYFTGQRADRDASIIYPALFQNSGRPKVVMLVEGASELVRSLRYHFADAWDEDEEERIDST